jgi:hypothetical protein
MLSQQSAVRLAKTAVVIAHYVVSSAEKPVKMVERVYADVELGDDPSVTWRKMRYTEVRL